VRKLHVARWLGVDRLNGSMSDMDDACANHQDGQVLIRPMSPAAHPSP
jgi:hypothetical protein